MLFSYVQEGFLGGWRLIKTASQRLISRKNGGYLYEALVGNNNKREGEILWLLLIGSLLRSFKAVLRANFAPNKGISYRSNKRETVIRVSHFISLHGVYRNSDMTPLVFPFKRRAGQLGT